MNKITIRKYDISDRVEVKKMFFDFFLYHTDIDSQKIRINLSIDQTTLLLDNLFNNINKKKGRFFVAEFQEQLVGFIAGYIKKTDKRKIQKEKKECVGHISKIYVKPEQRKKGIGRVLIEKMEEYFKENECDYATISSFAENDDAVCLYQKLGFSMRYISLLKPLKCKNLIIS